MQQSLADEWGDVELRWDFSEVVALQEDQAGLRAFALQSFQAGGITVHEFRRALVKTGLIEQVELDPRVGDVLYVPSKVTVTPIDPKALDERDAQAEAEREALTQRAQSAGQQNDEDTGEQD